MYFLMEVINLRELSGKLTSRALLFPETPGVLRLENKERVVNTYASEDKNLSGLVTPKDIIEFPGFMKSSCLHFILKNMPLSHVLS